MKLFDLTLDFLKGKSVKEETPEGYIAQIAGEGRSTVGNIMKQFTTKT